LLPDCMADTAEQVFHGGTILTMELSYEIYARIRLWQIRCRWLSWMITAITSVRTAWSILRVFGCDVKRGRHSGVSVCCSFLGIRDCRELFIHLFLTIFWALYFFLFTCKGFNRFCLITLHFFLFQPYALDY